MANREALETQALSADTLTGYTCNQISLGVLDSLIIDLGELQPNASGDLSGEIVLAVGCPWRIDGVDLPVVGWEDDEEEVASQATVLIGGTIDEVELRRPGYDLTIQFSNGFRLRVFPDCRAYFSEDLSGGALPWQVGGRALAAALSDEGTD